MPRLIAKSACDGLLPVTIGSVTLSEFSPDAITSLAPFNGRAAAVSGALKSAIGAGFPAANRCTGKAGARVAWSGIGQALVIGPRVEIDGAAMTDQTDAWACLALDGARAGEVLARLCPLDLRDSQFKTGHAARSLLGHMTGLFLRTGARRFELLVFRSMAQTAVHELTGAMTSVDAQA
ncbi:MAG: sarcosine oxidase subunit gamma [Rhodobacter sp.]|nr:sarcosine oxidase subunit gamma [Rhodobacter sp.]